MILADESKGKVMPGLLHTWNQPVNRKRTVKKSHRNKLNGEFRKVRKLRASQRKLIMWRYPVRLSNNFK